MSDPGFGGQAKRHFEFREWTRAALGDPRQVYARRAGEPPDAPLVFMPDGKALEFREKAKSGALICPVPGCPSPELTTRTYPDKRDHFMHVHAPEDPQHSRTYMRLATESLLRDWLAAQDQVVKVTAAEMDGVSFVLVAHLDRGNKVALCYVDKQLGADAWEERHDALRSKGIAGAWIFALRQAFFALPEPADPIAEDRPDLILDKAIYRRMRRRGSWPLLINLESEEVANPLKPEGGPATRLGFAPPDLDRVLHIAPTRLAACRISPYGIATRAISEFVLRASSK
jgi:hypothetical protein